MATYNIEIDEEQRQMLVAAMKTLFPLPAPKQENAEALLSGLNWLPVAESDAPNEIHVLSDTETKNWLYKHYVP